MGWDIKKAGIEEDRDKILQLLKESFSGYWTASQDIYTSDFWNWLYRDNTGGGSVNFIAEDKEKVIGHFPNVLERLKVNENIYKTGIVLHLTTHADYRNRGIFKNLGRVSIEELKKQGITFSFAFPNDKSRPGFINKLGFSSIATISLLVRPVNIKNTIKKIVKNPLLALLFYFILSPLYYMWFYHFGMQRKSNSVKIETKNSFGPEFDFLWKKAMAQAKVMVPRDSAFLNWRFMLRPNQRYHVFGALKNGELAGYIVTRTADVFSLKIGIIMDYFVLPGKDNIIEALVTKAIDNFKKDGVDLCITGCLKNNKYYSSLKNTGFVKAPERLNPRKLILVGRANQDVADKTVFLNGKNWFLSFGDWDTF
ncbi:MAG: GNAT family N-acetyltransferase [Candidatus Omnitrophota bacterium]|nr:GNAT family N-acetyltransferase [Candidatus Omnitrophota bacterium]